MFPSSLRISLAHSLLLCAACAQGCDEGAATTGDAATGDAEVPGDVSAMDAAGATTAGDAAVAADAGEGSQNAETGADAGGRSSDAEVDAAHEGPQASAHLVFVTSTKHSGALGGLPGADSICAERAEAAELDGEFIAWLSTAEVDAKSRFDPAAGPFVLSDGATLADDLDDLLDGQLGVPIDHDELGRIVGGDAWTGTLSDGRVEPDLHCKGFSSDDSADKGICGSTSASDSRWSAVQQPSCTTTLRLYCIQR